MVAVLGWPVRLSTTLELMVWNLMSFRMRSTISSVVIFCRRLLYRLKWFMISMSLVELMILWLMD